MNPADVNPYVRYCAKRIKENDYPQKICAYDFRLFYVTEGVIEFEFHGSSYKMPHGSVITVPPGVPYRLTFKNSEKVEYYIVNFDFHSKMSHLEARVPVEERIFDKNDIFASECIEPFARVFALENAESLADIFEKINETASNESYEAVIMNSALMKLAISQILLLRNKALVSGELQDLIEKIKAFIYDNACDCINNISVAKHFGYHPYYLNELFVNTEKTTLHRFIVNARIANIKRMLSESDQSLSLIASKCGFKDASYFSAFFRKATKMTPTEYRKLLK